MKTIGLLGGMSWVSTSQYYTALNCGVEELWGKNHSAKCVIYSYDFDTINPSYRSEIEIKSQLKLGIKALFEAGAEVIVICSNTMHFYADKLRKELRGRLLDIRDAVAGSLRENQIQECFLLGTEYTMNHSFYSSYLERNFQIQTNLPCLEERKKINQVIFKELINNFVSENAVKFFSELIENRSANHIVLACTELNLIFDQISTQKKIIDSTAVHIKAALNHLK